MLEYCSWCVVLFRCGLLCLLCEFVLLCSVYFVRCVCVCACVRFFVVCVVLRFVLVMFDVRCGLLCCVLFWCLFVVFVVL